MPLIFRSKFCLLVMLLWVISSQRQVCEETEVIDTVLLILDHPSHVCLLFVSVLVVVCAQTPQ